MSLQIALPHDALRAFCQRWRVSELALFGSAVQGNFRHDSDIDMLVRFAPDARWALLDFVQMRDELSDIFGRKVDLVTRRAVEASKNSLRRKAILESAQVIYAGCAL
ncbi:MAG: nucleotidyltransferase family protein [Anaerolineae bacterium]|nr:nucleotidyltransferase family protein [Anaerolineae bacterium]